MTEATKLPIKTEKGAPTVAPSHWAPFEAVRREIDRVFDRFKAALWLLYAFVPGA